MYGLRTWLNKFYLNQNKFAKTNKGSRLMVVQYHLYFCCRKNNYWAVQIKSFREIQIQIFFVILVLTLKKCILFFLVKYKCVPYNQSETNCNTSSI